MQYGRHPEDEKTPKMVELQIAKTILIPSGEGWAPFAKSEREDEGHLGPISPSPTARTSARCVRSGAPIALSLWERDQ